MKLFFTLLITIIGLFNNTSRCMEDAQSTVNFFLPGKVFYAERNKESPFNQFTELGSEFYIQQKLFHSTKSSILQKNLRNAAKSDAARAFGMLRSLMAIRAYLEKNRKTDADTAQDFDGQDPRIFIENSKKTISTRLEDLAKIAGIDPTKKARFEDLRLKILSQIPEMRYDANTWLTELMILEADSASGTESPEMLTEREAILSDRCMVDKKGEDKKSLGLKDSKETRSPQFFDFLKSRYLLCGILTIGIGATSYFLPSILTKISQLFRRSIRKF